MKNIIFFLLIVFFSFSAYSAQNLDNESCVGWIIDFKGIVKIYKENDFRGSVVKDNNTGILKGFAIKTGLKSEAKVDLIDDTKIILTEKSSAIFPKYNDILTDNGTVLFKVTKRDEIQGFTVKTKTATIGVKGTQFAVTVDNSSVKVFCKDGSVSVKSLKGEFKRYVKKELDDYSQFLKDQFKDYSKYKKELKEEFIKFVKEFDMKPDMAVVISDTNEVKNIDFPENINELFEELDKF
jgi:hypothetical protein